MIAVTGISGLVGGNLARALLAQGRPVRGLIHRDQRAVAGLEVELVEGKRARSRGSHGGIVIPTPAVGRRCRLSPGSAHLPGDG